MNFPVSPPGFFCTELQESFFPYMCMQLDSFPGFGVDDRLTNQLNETGGALGHIWGPPLFMCSINNFTSDTPSDEECGMCFLQYGAPFGSDNIQCRSCRLVGTDIVYDCRNLLTEQEQEQDQQSDGEAYCAARNAEGKCGGYDWQCNPSPFSSSGYLCNHINRASQEKDPFFPFDNNTDYIDVALLCASDISGFPLSACQEPRCFIVGADSTCASCQVLGNSSPFDFAYNCMDMVNLTCPILDETGHCVEIVSTVNDDGSNIFGIPSLQGTDDSGSNGWTWTITNVSPTTFNVISDIIGYITRIAFGLAFTAIYPLLMTWQLQRKKQVPIQALGKIPGDFFQASTSLSLFVWSFPAIIMAMLMLLADFSHTVADAGWDPVERQIEGPPEPILLISSTVEGRNLALPLESTGDPDTFRTSVVTVAYKEGRQVDSRPQSDIRDSFFFATTLIAQGKSPFVQEALRPRSESLSFGGLSFQTEYMPNDSPIDAMNQEIPLSCDTAIFSEIQEVMYGFRFDLPLYNTALVPNCTFSAARSTGIFAEDPNQQMEIVEHSRSAAIVLSIDGEIVIDIILAKDNETFQVFDLEHAQKKLARDRDDWKKGRVVDGIFDTLRIGSVTVDLGRIVLATGNVVSNRHTLYTFVSQINGGCPDRPSGLPSSDTQCLATIWCACDTFEEDIAEMDSKVYGPITNSSNCGLGRVSITWGRNFVADADLASAVAGIHGINRPGIFSIHFEVAVSPLTLVVLATGNVISDGHTSYTFVSQINGGCPDRPSGLPSSDTQCLATIWCACDTFEEDIAEMDSKVYGPITNSSNCGLGRVSITWGRNFVADADLASAVAGIHGINRPGIFSGDGLVADRADAHSILAALFRMGSLQERPSIEIAIYAQVSLTYVIFMLLPIALIVLLVLVTTCARDQTFQIPQSAWEMMVLAQEDPSIPKRDSRSGPFPKIQEDLVLAFFDASEGDPAQFGVGMLRTSEIADVDQKDDKESIPDFEESQHDETSVDAEVSEPGIEVETDQLGSK